MAHNIKVKCELCKLDFDRGSHLPILLQTCGHTFCRSCFTNKVVAEGACLKCKKFINYQVYPPVRNEMIYDLLFQENQKVVEFPEAAAISTQTMEPPKIVFADQPIQTQELPKYKDPTVCRIHPTMRLRFFCKTCNFAVCKQCIAEYHDQVDPENKGANSHKIIQIHTMALGLKDSVIDLQSLIQNTDRLSKEHKLTIVDLEDRMNQMMKKQLDSVEAGFVEIMTKLTLMKVKIKEEVVKKYEGEMTEAFDYQHKLEENIGSIHKIQAAFDQILDFMEASSDEKILQNAGEVTQFMARSTDDLQAMIALMNVNKVRFKIRSEYRPLPLNVREAVAAIQNMVFIPDRMLQDKVDLYKDITLDLTLEEVQKQILKINPDENLQFATHGFIGSNLLEKKRKREEETRQKREAELQKKKDEEEEKKNAEIEKFRKDAEAQDLKQTASFFQSNQRSQIDEVHVQEEDVSVFGKIKDDVALGAASAVRIEGRATDGIALHSQPPETAPSRELAQAIEPNQSAVGEEGGSLPQPGESVAGVPIIDNFGKQPPTTSADLVSKMISEKDEVQKRLQEEEQQQRKEMFEASHGVNLAEDANKDFFVLPRRPETEEMLAMERDLSKMTKEDIAKYEDPDEKKHTNIRRGKNYFLCFGELDNRFLMARMPRASKTVEALRWRQFNFHQDSPFQGGVKYMASCFAEPQCAAANDRDLLSFYLLSGGADFKSGQPLAQSYIIRHNRENDQESLKNAVCPLRVQDMIYRRYAHGLISLFDTIYAIGGYCHADVNGSKPMTLGSVEKFDLESMQWVEEVSMETPRAFFGACSVIDQFIYVFGGYFGNQMLSSIEKFDQILRCWTTQDVQLEAPLAKMGCISLEAANQEANIMIVGGFSPDFIRQAGCKIFDCQTTKFESYPSLKYGRVSNPGSSTTLLNGNHLLVFGGARHQDGGEYVFFNNPEIPPDMHKWELIPTYREQNIHIQDDPEVDYSNWEYEEVIIDNKPVGLEVYTIN